MDKFDILKYWMPNVSAPSILSKLAEICTRWLYHIGEQSHIDFLKDVEN